MDDDKIKQNTERVYRYLKDLGCDKIEIDKVASELIFYNEEMNDAMPV